MVRGPRGQPCTLRSFRLGLVTPESGSVIQLGNGSYDQLGFHPVRLTPLLSVLICYFVVGSVVGRELEINFFLIKSSHYSDVVAETKSAITKS